MHDDTTIAELYLYISHRGKCAQPVRPRYRARHDPWYREPKKGRYAPDDRRLKAQQACRGCPVINDCLEVALAFEAEAGASWGVWGATIPADRAKMLAERSQPTGILDEGGSDEGLVELDMASWEQQERPCITPLGKSADHDVDPPRPARLTSEIPAPGPR